MLGKSECGLYEDIWEKQREQLLQQVTTLRQDIASSRPMQIKACLLRNNKIQRFALATFPVDFSWRYVPAKVPFMEPLLYCVVSLAAGLQHAKREKL